MNAQELLEKYAAGERNFYGAYLTRADLTGADLADADLTRADLTGANLTGADLTGANLTGANLTGANLTGANHLERALEPVKADMFMKMCFAAHEVPALLEALRAGNVDGSVYQAGGKGCFVGTLACARGVAFDQIPGLVPNSESPVERFFLGIRDGHTPENNQLAAIAEHWILRFLYAWQPDQYAMPGPLVLPDVPKEARLEPAIPASADDAEDIPF